MVLSCILDYYLKLGFRNIPNESASQSYAKVNREENSAYNHTGVSSCFRHCSVYGSPRDPLGSIAFRFLEVQQRDFIV